MVAVESTVDRLRADDVATDSWVLSTMRCASAELIVADPTAVAVDSWLEIVPACRAPVLRPVLRTPIVVTAVEVSSEAVDRELEKLVKALSAPETSSTSFKTRSQRRLSSAGKRRSRSQTASPTSCSDAP